MAENIVKTISGKEIERKLCIKIGEDFYEKNVDCVSIDGRWFRKSNPKIYLNSVRNRYMKITEHTVAGICGYEPKDNSYIMGKFEVEFEEHYVIKTKRGSYYCATKEIFDSIPKVWKKSEGLFIDLEVAVYNAYSKSNDYPGTNYIYDFDRLYNSEKLIPIFSKVDNSKYTENLLDKINTANKSFELIDKYSFGLEFETCDGILPVHTCKQLGLIPLRDGSIRGHEYTTIPMKGADGINLLMNQIDALKSSCSIDKECSLHVHFGGFELSEKNVINLYNILYYLQDEIGGLFHNYIFNTGYYKASNKDYCKKFPHKIKQISELYEYLSDGNSDWRGDFYEPHPLNPRNDQKWNNNKRYYFVNLINLLFGKGAKTVEFRLHTPTLNYTKVINWLFICMGILKYAEDYNGDIDKLSDITLSDVILSSYKDDPSTLEIINGYILKRTEYASRNLRVFGDNYGVLDLIQDTDVEYKTPYHT